MISRTSPYRTHTGRYSAVTYCRLLVFTALTAHVFFLYENRGVADTSEPPFFETTIQPIFSKHCTDCHGPEVQEGGLDLSSAKGLLQGSESGPTFRAGNAEQSTLFGLIQRGDMPPAEEEQPKQRLKPFEFGLNRVLRFRMPNLATRVLRNTMSSPFCSYDVSCAMVAVPKKRVSICVPGNLCCGVANQVRQSSPVIPRKAC